MDPNVRLYFEAKLIASFIFKCLIITTRKLSVILYLLYLFHDCFVWFTFWLLLNIIFIIQLHIIWAHFHVFGCSHVFNSTINWITSRVSLLYEFFNIEFGFEQILLFYFRKKSSYKMFAIPTDRLPNQYCAKHLPLVSL